MTSLYARDVEMQARPCIRSTARVEGGREETEADKMFAKLQSIALKAECSQQYDPPVEGYMVSPSGAEAGLSTETIRTETAKFLYVLALGLAGVAFWRGIR